MLDLLSLRHALVVAEHMSICRAAAHLGLQPSAISRRLQTLEQQLGTSLFERNSAGAQMTPAGRRFLRRARWALADLDDAARAAAGVQTGRTGTLGVSFYPSLASGLLHRILDEHRARFPDLEVWFREGASADQLTALRRHQVDVAFLMDAPDFDGGASEHLWDERIYVASPAGHRVAASETVTWATLRNETFVVRAYGCGPVIVYRPRRR